MLAQWWGTPLWGLHEVPVLCWLGILQTEVYQARGTALVPGGLAPSERAVALVAEMVERETRLGDLDDAYVYGPGWPR